MIVSQVRRGRLVANGKNLDKKGGAESGARPAKKKSNLILVGKR